MPITPEQARAELARRELARREAERAQGGDPGAFPAESQQSRAPQPPTAMESLGRGALQGATLGFSDEAAGAIKALNGAVEAHKRGESDTVQGLLLASPLANMIYGWLTKRQPDLTTAMTGETPLARDYRSGRDEARAANEAAQKANPKTYLGGEIAGGLATAVVPGGAAAKGASATKAAIALAKSQGLKVAEQAGAKLSAKEVAKRALIAAVPAAKVGSEVGAAAGLGGSKADLTRGEYGQAAADTAIGAGLGAGLSAAARPVASAVGAGVNSAANKLRELGQARLFKAAVGQTKRAFTQMNGKGLLEKAGQYLEDMKIGLGDSTESIAKKLAARDESIQAALTDTVQSLDAASGGKITIDPNAVADQIEKKVAAPLKKLAAARGEYEKVMEDVNAIRQLSEQQTFADAAAQRRAFQQRAHYDRLQGNDIGEKARRQIASIWNDEIDRQAEPLLRQAGKKGTAYRELRHESQLVQELRRHVESRVSGNAANRVLSPSDYGVGGISGVMSGNPVVGLAGAIANHLARVYGNAAAGRAAINMAKMASRSSNAARYILPPILQGARAAPPSLPQRAPMLIPQYAQTQPPEVPQ